MVTIHILVASLAAFVFGALWFTFLFGRTWAKLMDFNPAGDAKAREMGMVKPLIMNFLLNVVTVSVVYCLFSTQLFAVTYVEFLKIILSIWLGFSFVIYANAAVWERKSWTLVLINSAYGIISFTIISTIVYYWQ